MEVLAQVSPSDIDLVQVASDWSGPTLVLVLVVLLMRGHLITKLRHEDMIAHYERLVDEKDARLEASQQDAAWWKDAAVTALQIGEVAVGRSRNE